MTCDELRAYFETTLAEELTAERMEEVREHARQCPACDAYVRGALDLERQLGALPSFAAGKAVMVNVMARVERAADAREGEASESHVDLVWAAMLALGLFLSILSYSVTPRGGEWIEQLLAIRWQLAASPGNLFSQPWPVTMLSALGASLAALAILWQASRKSRTQDAAAA